MSEVPGRVVVTSVQGTTPGPASGISYTVDYYGSDGIAIQNLAGVVPVTRGEDDGVYINAARVSSGWGATMSGNKLLAYIFEAKASGPCT